MSIMVCDYCEAQAYDNDVTWSVEFDRNSGNIITICEECES